jgi:hypothetical protein
MSETSVTRSDPSIGWLWSMEPWFGLGVPAVNIESGITDHLSSLERPTTAVSQPEPTLRHYLWRGPR